MKNCNYHYCYCFTVTQTHTANMFCYEEVESHLENSTLCAAGRREGRVCGQGGDSKSCQLLQ